MNISSTLTSIVKKPALRQGLIVLIDQGFFSLATFVIGVLVARANSKEEYGIYVLGWSLLFILQGIHKALISTPFTIYAPRLQNDERKAYQGSSLVHTLILCALFTLTLWIFYFWEMRTSVDGEISLYTILPWLVLMLTPILLREFIRNALLAQLQIWASVGANVFTNLLLLTLATVFFLAKQLTLNTALQVFALTSLFASIIMFWTQRHQFTFHRNVYVRHFRQSWKTGKWILINVFAYMGSSQAYPWLLLYLMDYQAVAIFGACLATAYALSPLLRGGYSYVLPRMSHGYKDGNPANVARLLRLSILALSIPFCLWLLLGAIFSNEIVPLLYSESYSGYGIVFILLLIKATIESISMPFTSALQTLERPDVTTVSLIIGASITLTLGLFMIKQYGLYGAGITTIISTSATVGYRWYFLVKILKQRHLSNTNSYVDAHQ